MKKKTKPIPTTHGKHMTMAEFVEDCESGMLTDWDGFAYAATKTEMYSTVVINPPDVLRGKFVNEYTHVWFNK